MALRVGLERGQIDDRQLGDEVLQFGRHRTDQELTDEQRMPGQFGENPGFYPVFRVGAAVEVLREQRLAARMRDEVVIEQLEVCRADLAVTVPPHRVLGQRIDDRVLVLGRAAGVDAGFRAQRAALDDRGLARRDGMLVKRGRGQIPMHRAQIFETEFIGAEGAVPQTRFLHENLHDTRQPPDLLLLPYPSGPMIAPTRRSRDL